MAINKVVYGTDTLMDITDTTATAEDVTSGKVFYGANGVKTTGSASYTETDPIFTASAAHSISSSDITNWNNKVDTNDYAGSANNSGGTVVLKTTYCADTNASGVLYCFNRTYSQYASMDNSAFISKGTLENVIEGKGLVTADDLVCNIIDFTDIMTETGPDLSKLKNIFNTYSAVAANGFEYNKKGLYKIIVPYEGVTVTQCFIGTLHDGSYDETSTSTLRFDTLPGGYIQEGDNNELKRLIITLTYHGDGTTYDNFDDYEFEINEIIPSSQIKMVDFRNIGNEQRMALFEKLSDWGGINDNLHQYANYDIYKIKTLIQYYGNNKQAIFIGTLSSATYNQGGDSEIIFNVLAGGHESDPSIYGSGLLKLKLTYTGDGTTFDPYNDYTFTSEYTPCLTTEITSSSTDEQYPTAKSVYDFVTSQGGGGGGTATTVQINGTSITSNNVANILTNSAYNASSNKIATMNDISPTTVQINGTSITSSGTANIATEGTYNSSTNKIATKSYVDNNATLSSTIRTIATLTQTQYNALSTKDNNTLYIIVG
jgi:hypothetical protein